MEKSVYVPVRLPLRAAEKLDAIARQRLCSSRSEAIRRLIDDHIITPWHSSSWGNKTKNAPEREPPLDAAHLREAAGVHHR
jgi:metal-responsive CopG/Arc/MetJ family transcriptional regulator